MSAPLPTTSIHHVSFLVKDAEKTEAFYRNVLGFAPLVRPALKFPGAWLFKDGLQIHLIQHEDAFKYDAAAEITSRADHIAFHSEDIDRVEALLKEHDVAYRVNIQAGSGLKQLFFHDPDGHTLEMANYPAPTKV